MSTYLIQGFFFQEGEWQILKNGTITPAIFGTYDYMFAGIIFPDEMNAVGGFTGKMQDCWGESVLSSVHFHPESYLDFIKKYEKRQDLVEYHFKLQNGVWSGEFSGSEVGKGVARCIITKIDEDFLKVPI